jgi:hypothetical protein
LAHSLPACLHSFIQFLHCRHVPLRFICSIRFWRGATGSCAQARMALRRCLPAIACCANAVRCVQHRVGASSSTSGWRKNDAFTFQDIFSWDIFCDRWFLGCIHLVSSCRGA